MGITLVIVGGIVLCTVIGVTFDYLGKKKSGIDPQLEERITTLEQKQNVLENLITEKTEKIEQLNKEVAFVNKLLDQRFDK